MDIKTTSTKDIYKSIQQDYAGLYSTLEKILGQDNPFAKCTIGAGVYVWSSPEDEWRPMVTASNVKQEFVRQHLTELRQKISSKIGDNAANDLFTYPDDSYVYFKDEGDDIRLLLTGWGFKKPISKYVGPETKKLTQDNPICLSFSNDGVKLPNYEFGLKAGRKAKVLKTDDTGYFRFDDLQVGEHFILNDLQSGKEYELAIVEGKSEYDFDVTMSVPVTVNTLYDNQPIVGEIVHIKCCGKDYEAVTDVSGNASMSLPYHNGMEVNAVFRGEAQSQNISKEGCHFSFSFEQKPFQKEIDVKVKVQENSIPVQSKSVHVTYVGKGYDAQTSATGECRFTLSYIPNESCNVTVDGYDVQAKELLSEGENIFVFDKEVKKEEKTFDAHVVVISDNGFKSGYPVILEYNGERRECVTDQNGEAGFDRAITGEVLRVTDGKDSSHVQEYNLDEKVSEYVFHVDEKIIVNKESVIKIMLRDARGESVKCDYIRFEQEGKDIVLGRIDEEGNTYFAANAFETGKTINASIVGADRDFPVIPFELDEYETEYLLQENENKSSVWKKLFEILLIILALIAMICIGIAINELG